VTGKVLFVSTTFHSKGTIMQLNPYLIFNGTCEPAFKFYEQVLKGKIATMMRFGETPAAEHVPAEYANKIMHATLKIGEQVIMASDEHPMHPYEGIKGSGVALHCDNVAEGERVFNALSDGALVVTMPLQETFWAARFGMLTDKFGVPWMINCEKAS
jgi:PhnB protein